MIAGEFGGDTMTMKDFIECAMGPRCTVLTKDNQFCFVGRITQYDPETDMIRLLIMIAQNVG